MSIAGESAQHAVVAYALGQAAKKALNSGEGELFEELEKQADYAHKRLGAYLVIEAIREVYAAERMARAVVDERNAERSAKPNKKKAA